MHDLSVACELSASISKNLAGKAHPTRVGYAPQVLSQVRREGLAVVSDRFWRLNRLGGRFIAADLGRICLIIGDFIAIHGIGRFRQDKTLQWSGCCVVINREWRTLRSLKTLVWGSEPRRSPGRLGNCPVAVVQPFFPRIISTLRCSLHFAVISWRKGGTQTRKWRTGAKCWAQSYFLLPFWRQASTSFS